MEEEKEEVKVPFLYAYIYKSIKTNCLRITESDKISLALKRVVYRIPKLYVREVLLELEQMGLIKKLDFRGTRYEVIENNNCKKQLNRLKEYVFPLSPSNTL